MPRRMAAKAISEARSPEIIDLNYEDYHEEITMPDQGLRMKRPAHPGSFIRSEIIEDLKLSIKQAADALGVTREALSAVLNERSRLSPGMALRVEKDFGVSMDTLMRMQNSYDIARARSHESEIIIERFTPKISATAS